MQRTIVATVTLSLTAFAFAGCAATSPTDTTPQPLAVELPERVDGNIDISSLRSHEIQQLERNQVSSLRVRLCVSPDGSVAGANLVQASGHAGYDNAVVSSMKAWKYRPYAANDSARVCKVLRVQYNGA